MSEARPLSAARVARQLAERIELRGAEYALGGAIALGRRKDLADVEQILRAQGPQFDRAWVREQLAEMYGARDPRLAAWDDLVREVQAE